MQVTDAMVAAAVKAAVGVWNQSSADTQSAMRAALTAALAEMWRPVSEAKLDQTRYLIATESGQVLEAAFYPEYGYWLDEYGAREDPWVGNAYRPVKIIPLPAPPMGK